MEQTELRGGRGLSQEERYIYLQKQLKKMIRAFESFPVDEERDIEFINYVTEILELLRSWLKAKNEEERLEIQKEIVRGSKSLYKRYKEPQAHD